MAGKTVMFSICIPLYNGERYIAECIESALSQDFEDYEILIVNDGSTDRSISIAEAYAKKNDKIRILTQENKGIFHTRLRLFQEAIGQYIFSLDADDYLEPIALSTVAQSIFKNHSDIVLYNYFQLDDASGQRELQTPILPEGNYCGSDLMSVRELFLFTKKLNPVWVKVIRKDLLHPEDYLNYPKIGMWDDWILSLAPMLSAESIEYIPAGLINYRVITSSMTGKFDITLFDTLKLIYSLKQEYREIIANGNAPIVQYDEKCDLNYLTEVSKTIAYVPGKVYDRRGYKTLLHKIRDDAEVASLYHAKGSELAMVYRLPLIFLSHRFDILLLGMKQLSSFLRKKR